MESSGRSARSPIHHLKEECHKPDYHLPPKSSLPSSPRRLVASILSKSEFGKSVRSSQDAYTAHRESTECNRGVWWTNFSAATADLYPTDLLIGQCKSPRERSCAERFVKQLAPHVRNKQPDGVWEAGAELMTELVLRCQAKDHQTLLTCAEAPPSAWLDRDSKQAPAIVQTGVPAESLPAFARAAFVEKLSEATTVKLAAGMSCTEGTGQSQRVTAATSQKLWTEFQRRLKASVEHYQRAATAERHHSFDDVQANIRSTPTASEILAILDQVIIDNFSLELPSSRACASSTPFPVAGTPATPAASDRRGPAAQPRAPVKVSIRKSTERFGLPPPPLFSKIVRQLSADAQLKQYGEWLERVHARLHELAGTRTAADLQRALFGTRVLSSAAKHSVNKILFTGRGALTVDDLVNLGTHFDALLRVLVDSNLDPLGSGSSGGERTQVGPDPTSATPAASAK